MCRLQCLLGLRDSETHFDCPENSVPVYFKFLTVRKFLFHSSLFLIWKLNLTFRRPGNYSKPAEERFQICCEHTAGAFCLLFVFFLLGWLDNPSVLFEVIGRFVWIVRFSDFLWDRWRFLRRLLDFHWLAGVYPCPNIIFEIFKGISFIWIKSLLPRIFQTKTPFTSFGWACCLHLRSRRDSTRCHSQCHRS